MANADLERIIKIVFAGDDKQAVDSINRVTSGLSTLDGAVSTFTDPLAGMADNVLKVDAALLALVAGGLLYALNKTKEFENATVELVKVIGDEIGRLDEVKKFAIDISDVYGESSSAVLASVANFKQAGFGISESMLLTKNAMDLKIAGDISAAESSEVLVSILKGFKAPAEDAARVVDILNEVSNKYATDVRQLATGMAELSPIANAMGFSFEETAGVLTPVIEVFRSGGESAIALKTGLLKLIDDSKPVREALERLGVSQFDVNGHMRSGKDILLDVAKAFQTAEQNDKLFLTQQLVGIQQAGRMVEVFDGLAKSTEVTNVALGSTGSAAEEVAARLASAEVAVNRFKEGFNNLAISVGSQFAAAAKEAVDGGTSIENVLRTMVDDGTFEPIFAKLRDFSARFGQYLGGIAEALPEAMEQVDFSGFLAALGSLGDTLGGFFGALDLTKPDDLARALQTVVDAVTGLIRITDGMAEAFKPFFSQIVDFLLKVADSDEELQKTIGKILSFAKQIESTSLAVVVGLAAMREAGVAVGPVFDVLAGTIQIAFNGIQISFDTLMLTLALARQGFAKFWDTITLGKSDVFHQQLLDAEADVSKWADAVVRDGTDAANGLNRVAEGFSATGESADAAGTKIGGVKGQLDTIPSHTQAEVEFYLSGQDKLAAAHQAITDLPGQKNIEITTSDLDSMRTTLAAFGIDIANIPEEKLVALKAITDDASYNAAVEQLMIDFPTEKSVSIRTAIDGASMAEAQGEFNRFADLGITVTVDDSGLVTITNELAGAKDLNITAKVDKAKAESDVKKMADAAKELEKSVEWRAKLDIAEVEANAKILAATLSTLGSTFDASTSHASAMMKEWSDAQGKSGDIWSSDVYKSNQLTDMMESEELNRQSMLSQQRDLTAAEIDYMRARTTALAQGDALIKIDGSGLAPHLEAIMWDVLGAIQVRANEDGQSMLLGLS
jgi:TP901 family phage tail tape measure protein